MLTVKLIVVHRINLVLVQRDERCSELIELRAMLGNENVYVSLIEFKEDDVLCYLRT